MPSSCCSEAAAAGTQDAGRDRRRVDVRLQLGLAERRRDDPDASVGRLHELCRVRPAQPVDLVDQFVGCDRERHRVDDQAIDEVRHVVNFIGDDPTGDEHLERVGRVLDELDESLDVAAAEQVRVVDDDRPGGHVVIGR